jgi:hypothetical protein
LKASHVSDVLTARKVATQSLTVGAFESRPVPVSFLTNLQVESTLNGNTSRSIGNIIIMSIDVSLNMLVDFSAYPVVVGSVPAEYAPPNDVFLPMCLVFPPAPTPGVFVLLLDPTGTISTCSTGLPFPVGVYRVTVTGTYFLP